MKSTKLTRHFLKYNQQNQNKKQIFLNETKQFNFNKTNSK